MKKTRVLWVVLLLLLSSHLNAFNASVEVQAEAVGSQVPLVTNIFARPSLSLCGQWNYIVDPLENGYYDYRRKPWTTNGFFENKISSRDCFFGSAAFTDLIHNIQLTTTGADISFTAPLSFNTSIEQGPFHVSDLFKLYRFENLVTVLTMTGSEVRKHLEMSYDLWINTMTKPDDHILRIKKGAFATKPDSYSFIEMTFNFDSAAGIDYEVDVTKKYGERVRILRMSNGEPFDEQKTYKVVMNSYRSNGGGELLTKGAGIPHDEIAKRIIYQSERDQRHYLMQEIEKAGHIAPKANNNWRFVPTEWAEPALKRDRKLIFNE